MSQINVDTIKKADGTGSLSVPAESGTVVTTASPSLGRRNLIINGAMQVAQRGTSQTAAGYGSLDRWLLSLSGATATLSQESFTLGQTDVVGAEYYAKLAVTTGNNNCGLYYKVEAKDVINAGGQEVTLSYWAKGTSPTDGLRVGLSLIATGGSATGDNTVTLTGTWTKYTHTFTMPSFSGVTLDASSYLEIHWDQDAGDTGTAAWELNIAQVQLEVGSVATPFEHRSYGEELALCQRYFCKIENTAGGGRYFGILQAYASDSVFGIVANYPQIMRATPSVSQGGTFGFYGPVSQNANANTSITNLGSTSRSWQTGGWGGSSILTAGHAAATFWESGAYLTADAEL